MSTITVPNGSEFIALAEKLGATTEVGETKTTLLFPSHDRYMEWMQEISPKVDAYERNRIQKNQSTKSHLRNQE